MLPIVRQFHLHPRFKGILLRRTYPELESEIILRSHEFYAPCGATYNDTKKRWTFPSGAVMQFGHCENEKDVKKYDTSQYNYAGFDELTSFTEYQYVYIAFTRVRSSDNRLPSIVRSGTNPGNTGHSWCYNRFVKPCETGYKIIRRHVVIPLEGKKIEKTVDAIYIPSKATDNPYLMEADPGYLTRLASLPAAERAAKLEGRWDSFEGQVFDEFAEHSHVVEIAKDSIPYYWPKVLSIDWGYAAMMCAGLYAINPVPNKTFPAKIYKIKEYTCTKTKVSTWATDLRRMFSNENLVDVVLDPSAWQERGQGLIASEFAENFGRDARRATNDRIGGKILLQEYLRVTPRPPRYIPREGFDLEVALRIKRMSGDKAFDDYRKLFEPEVVETYLPKLMFDKSCEKTIECLPHCVYAANTKGKPNEDVAEFPGDDPYDETRYGLQACQGYLDNGVDKFRMEEKVSDALASLEQTKDMTSFYMKMDKIDSSGRSPDRVRYMGNRRRVGR
jgi:Terminase large subunit, T4likevirus-type, N-terminal